jgi:hypothetical protein
MGTLSKDDIPRSFARSGDEDEAACPSLAVDTFTPYQVHIYRTP